MTAYRFTQRYRSSYGAGDEGDVVDLTDEQAADINRDSPGTLVLADADHESNGDDDTNERAVEKAPRNRQVTGAKNRGDRGAQEPIDKTSFKAVRDKE